jgi:enoyl-CoA hydratase/carnithine racemase
MSTVLYDVQDRIATIRFNRPERLNAYGRELRREYAEAFGRFEQDATADVVIICGAGKAFSAGRDLKEELETGKTMSQDHLDDSVLHTKLHVKIIDKPIIAAIHGYCLGAGANIMLGCDYRIAASNTVIDLSHVATGVLGSWHLPVYQVLPWALAIEFVMLNRRLTPQRLREVGLVNEVVEPGTHEQRAREVAEEFLKLPQEILRATKAMMNKARPRPSDDMLAEHWDLVERLRVSTDARRKAGEDFLARKQGN